MADAFTDKYDDLADVMMPTGTVAPTSQPSTMIVGGIIPAPMPWMTQAPTQPSDVAVDPAVVPPVMAPSPMPVTDNVTSMVMPKDVSDKIVNILMPNGRTAIPPNVSLEKQKEVERLMSEQLFLYIKFPEIYKSAGLEAALDMLVGREMLSKAQQKLYKGRLTEDDKKVFAKLVSDNGYSHGTRLFLDHLYEKLMKGNLGPGQEKKSLWPWALAVIGGFVLLSGNSK